MTLPEKMRAAVLRGKDELTIEDVELATLGWVHWWNTTRLLEPIGNLPPAEFEANFAAAQKTGRSLAQRAS